METNRTSSHKTQGSVKMDKVDSTTPDNPSKEDKAQERETICQPTHMSIDQTQLPNSLTTQT